MHLLDVAHAAAPSDVGLWLEHAALILDHMPEDQPPLRQPGEPDGADDTPDVTAVRQQRVRGLRHYFGQRLPHFSALCHPRTRRETCSAESAC